MQRHAGLFDRFLAAHAIRKFHQLQAIGGHVEHAQLGDDAVHHAHAGQRQGALGDDLRGAGLGDVLHQHHHALHAGHLGIALDEKQDATLRTVFEKILANNLAQPQVFVHRDYHSRNLMVLSGDYPANPGVIDFQDAVYGPITYDLVSLYRDAYITWDEKDELDFVIRYWEMARKAGLPVHADFHDFYRDYEWMGVQRQIKVLGIFARLCYRDGKDAYLNDMPRVMAYLRRTCERYLELKPLVRLLDQLESRPVETGLTF